MTGTGGSISCTAVLDIGKTNVKLVVLNRRRETVWQDETANTVLPAPPYPHFDVDGIWEWLLDALTRAAADHPIDAVLPVTHGAAAVAVDGDGRALPVLDYEHDGPEDDAAYAEMRPAFAETASPPLPGGLNLGRQLHWLQTAHPDLWARRATVLLYPQYWCRRLGGRVVSEYTSIGCHTDLWAPAQTDFSSLARAEGWDALFPAFERAGADLGPIDGDVARRTGLAADCRVLNGLHDSNASYLRHLTTRSRPFTVLSTGTWVITMSGMDSDQPPPLNEARDTLANVDINGKPVPCARFMGGREFAAICPHPPASPVTDGDIQAVIDAGALALPSFAGRSGPYPDTDGRIVNPPDTDSGRAALASLYCALMTRTCVDLVDGQGDIAVDGPFARNTAYCGILAALFPQRRVIPAALGVGTADGAAMLIDADRTASPDPEPIPALPLTGLDAYADAWAQLIPTR